MGILGKSHQTGALVFALGSLYLSACKPEDILPIQAWGKQNKFTIKAGANYSDPRKVAWGFQIEDGLYFSANLHDDTIYTFSNNDNQVNKIFGISDCGSDHTVNGARLGFIYQNGAMYVLPYIHLNGVEVYDIKNPLAKVEVNRFYHYRIRLIGKQFEFGIQDDTGNWTTQLKDRACTGDTLVRYVNQPFFGGQHPAPKEMTIEVNLD